MKRFTIGIVGVWMGLDTAIWAYMKIHHIDPHHP